MNKSAPMEYEKAIEYIDQMIRDGELVTGSRLPTERTISEHLGIGRNSTREALSILHGMGMIKRVQGSGNYVTGDAHPCYSPDLYYDACSWNHNKERCL